MVGRPRGPRGRQPGRPSSGGEPWRARRALFDVDGRPGFQRAARDAVARRLPYLDEGMLEMEQEQPRVRHLPAPAPRPVEVPEQVLRILVGDLAPQAQTAINIVQTNELVNTAASVGSAALGALILPTLFR